MTSRSQPPEAVVILLGAGRPYRGTPPAALQQTPDQRRVLDWIMDAFSGVSVDWHFVGGYHLRDVARRYPDLAYSVNPDWQTTGAVASLFAAPLAEDLPHYVAYTDVVFARQVVADLREADADAVLAVDGTWRRRYERRHAEELRLAEKVQLDGDRVRAVGSSLDPDASQAEFAGLVKLSPAAMAQLLRLRESDRERLARAGLPQLLDELRAAGLDCVGREVGGSWAELNAPQDLARFVLGTKAETLERLQRLVRHSVIGDQVTFTVAAWESEREALLDRITAAFAGHQVVVRSSALAEDSWTTANAGTFVSVTHVPVDSRERLAGAVEEVVASFDDGNPDNQVLVQEMLTDVKVSGVAFTRSLTSGAPYYVVNYDETTGGTDSVTGGTGRHLRSLIVHRRERPLPQGANPSLARLLRALRELEGLVGHDSLDVEFAISREGEVHVLQVRPIAVDHSRWRVSDEVVEGMLSSAEREFRDRQSPRGFEVGDRTLFGVMPDWNPAEIIGTKPRRLATSLYRRLVTDEVWAAQRAGFGYRDVRPCPLLTCFLGHPYIDVRASFSSFVPASVPDDLAGRLVNSYLERLAAHPALHDKVEFDIVLTCLTLDFDAQAGRLRDAGFGEGEIDTLRDALRGVTRHALERWRGDLDEIDLLERRFATLGHATGPPLARAAALLEDCVRHGTLPFAHLARGAFVATALLRSAVAEGLLRPEDLAAFMGSLNTVARRFGSDGARVAAGELDWDEYVARYGHLRPGTYEITSPCYAEDPERYLRPMVTGSVEEAPAFAWPAEAAEALEERLREAGVLRGDEGLDAFDAFCRAVIEGREYGKFVFSRNLSAALEAIAAFGDSAGLSREQLSHVAVEDLLTASVGGGPTDLGDWLLERSEEGRQWHDLTQAIELPPLLVQADDLFGFLHPESQPNFVSLGKVSAEVVDLTDVGEASGRLAGRIALIPQADPGYDWLFGQKVAGLITMYGGANSHMAIRAAEFGLPAAIGVGESVYTQYRHAHVIQLDCAGRNIQVLR